MSQTATKISAMGPVSDADVRLRKIQLTMIEENGSTGKDYSRDTDVVKSLK